MTADPTPQPQPARPAGGPPRSMRRRLFVSHVLVMVVALVVLAVVFALIQVSGGARTLGADRRSGGAYPLPLAIAAAAGAAGLVSWWVTRRLAEPLDRIGAATRQLAAGHYDVQVPRSDTIELDALASHVNHLAQELGTTEARRLRLIGDVAHELRNPLSTIQGTMEALLDGVVAADDDTYARIGREAARLRRLADDLSSLSAAGELGVLNEERVDLGAIVADVVAQLQPQSAAKDLALAVEGADASPALPPVRGDTDRLTQVLMNVVGNAIQYTDDGGIAVRTNATARTVSVEIVDTGRGLTGQDQTRIFERFHRVDQHFTDGTGVGLAIAKLIVEAHGGTIEAASAGPGNGTTVTIELPTDQG